MHYIWTKTIKSIVRDEPQAVLQFIVLSFFFFPLFIQLSGQIFHPNTFPFKLKGNILEIPLPIALPFCFIAIILCYRFENRHFGMDFVLLVFMCMLFSLIISSSGQQQSVFDKFLLLIQFILPLFAYILGRLYQPGKSAFLSFQAIIFYVLLVIIPLQTLSTLLWTRSDLSPNLFIFSLYQHIQYLPVIFLAFYFIALTSLYHIRAFRIAGLLIAPLMGIYIAASIQLSSLLLVAACSILFLITISGRWVSKALTLMMIWISLVAYLPMVEKYYREKFNIPQQHRITDNQDTMSELDLYAVMAEKNQSLNLPLFLFERIAIWEYYWNNYTRSPKVILFGNRQRPDREIYPSAHNYYLDLIYNFGLISLLPFLFVIALTISKSIRLVLNGQYPRNLIVLGFVTFYFIFVENFMKVPFRQPYPGMMMFFLWGIYNEQLVNLCCQNSVKTQLIHK